MNFQNISTGTVHSGKVRPLRADFTESGYVEWATADCEKGAAYRSINRMQLVATDAEVTCQRCAARTAPAKAPQGFHLTVTDGHGYTDTFRTERSALIWAVRHMANHTVFGYALNQDSVDAVLAATGTSADEFAAKVARKEKAYRKEMASC